MKFFRRKSDKVQEQKLQPTTRNNNQRESDHHTKKEQKSFGFGSKLRRLLAGSLDSTIREQLEELLLLADSNLATTENILRQLEVHPNRQNPFEALAQILEDMLKPAEKKLMPRGTPWVVLVVGSNGVGKTTTIAKMANYYKQQGYKPMFAAGDTFRAAAVSQLEQWARRLDLPVTAQAQGADSAAVVFDAIGSAKAKGCDLVLADTAGRLQNKDQLLDELGKIKRVASRALDGAPHETLLVIDATTGQNSLHMVEAFHSSIAVSGLIMTKLDGSAKGGTLFSICHTYGLPIPFIGSGEKLEDFSPFDAHSYVDSLLAGST